MSDEIDRHALVKHFLAIAAGKQPGHAGTPEFWITSAQDAAAERDLAFPPPGWTVRTSDTGQQIAEETGDEA